ncbi:MAG: two-component response regulator [Ignavibacteria bacterium]|nr:two-component response regulator [Ignavibacteria bacterium]
MGNDQNNLYSKFIEAIEQFSKHRSFEPSVHYIGKAGLEVFLNLPSIKLASLFMLDEDTFEFEHAQSLPEDYSGNIQEIFRGYVNAGNIGMALQAKDRILVEDTGDGISIIIPLIKANGILGVVILKFFVSAELPDEIFLNLFDIHSSLLAYATDNIMLKNYHFISQEILDQKVAFRTLNLVQSKKKLADKFENLQSNLSMSISHEFRTPLNQILGATDFLTKYFKDIDYEEAKELLSDIRLSAERLRRMTENYIFYANLTIMSSSVLDILNMQNKITYSAGLLFNDIMLNMANELGRSADLKTDIEDVSVHIASDYFVKLIKEVFDNSVKYSENGTPVIVSGKIDDNLYHLSFTDFGRGLTAEQKDSFDAYMQFERQSYEQQGIGLGLSIVMKLVNLHNGEFFVDSEVGKFTTIHIKLPFSRENPI